MPDQQLDERDVVLPHLIGGRLMLAGEAFRAVVAAGFVSSILCHTSFVGLEA